MEMEEPLSRWQGIPSVVFFFEGLACFLFGARVSCSCSRGSPEILCSSLVFFTIGKKLVRISHLIVDTDSHLDVVLSSAFCY